MVSERTKHLGIGSIITFFVSLGTAIPGFGLFLGPIFTFGGGLTGAGVASWLQKTGSKDGVKIGIIVALAGGVTSSIVAVTGGTLLNMFLVAEESSGETGGWILLAIIGFVSGLIFTLIGGIVGGAVAGHLSEES